MPWSWFVWIVGNMTIIFSMGILFGQTGAMWSVFSWGVQTIFVSMMMAVTS